MMKREINSLVERLVKYVYLEFQDSKIEAGWGKTNCFATISWNQNLKEVKIRCNNETRLWHDAALFGLLSHELSHPTSKPRLDSEMHTDMDVIERGLGVYLAVERIIAGKYDDHVIKRGKDRYLGYSSIRGLLFEQELIHLDTLLLEMRLIPDNRRIQTIQHHDMYLVKTKDAVSIHVDGQEFSVVGEFKDSDVKIVDKGNKSFIYVDDVKIAQLETDSY